MLPIPPRALSPISADAVPESRLQEIERAEAKTTAKREVQASQYAKIADIRSRLANHADGYFVVYAEENVAPPRRGGIYFYHCRYEVLAGLEAAFLRRRSSRQLVVAASSGIRHGRRPR